MGARGSGKAVDRVGPRQLVPRPWIESLPAEPAEEFLLVHPVLEDFTAIDEDNGDFVIIETADFRVGIDVDFAPVEAPAFV
jgi:hypothetical protein